MEIRFGKNKRKRNTERKQRTAKKLFSSFER
jgi:hypothetical protein